MKILLAVILAIILMAWGGLSLWAGTAATLVADNPAQALEFAPHQARALAARVTAQREGSSELIEAQAEALLRAAPLSDLPLVYRGEAFLSAGQFDEAARFLDAALARNPRREATLAWRAAVAVAQEDTEGALSLLARLVVLDPPQAGVYLNAIAVLAQRPEGRTWLLSESFARDPAFTPIVQHLTGVYPDLGVLLRLNQTDPIAQAALIERALRERGASVAFILWISLLPPEASAAFTWPFNPRFEEMAAPAPFNWSGNTRATSFEEGRGLVVTYNGRGRQMLVGQMMLLRPGRYSFSSPVSGDGQERGGGLVWEISCASEDAPVLARTEKAGHQGGPRAVEMTFEVPAQACDGQRLTLLGVPGEFPMRTRATIAQVAITQVAS
jgi:hypothetical protein